MNKLIKLFELSKQRNKLYPMLIALSAYRANDDLLNEVIDKLKKLSEEEDIIISSMTPQELDIYLDELIKKPKSEPRVFGRLLNRKEILLGHSIERNYINHYNLPNVLTISTFDYMLSKINIDVMKSLKRKIEGLTPECDTDDEFVVTLKEELELAKIEYLHRTLTSETLALNSNNDLDEIPQLVMPKTNQLSSQTELSLSQNTSSKESLPNKMLSLYISSALSKIENTTIIENNPSSVFAYLDAVTRIETILEYMPEETQRGFYDEYEKLYKNNTNPSTEYIRVLIKEKIKSSQDN